MKIGVIGDIAIDYIGTVDAFPELNSNCGITSLEQGFGGSAANTAVMCAQLGSETKLLACAGSDFPAGYRSKLTSLGLAGNLIEAKDRTTSAFLFSKGNSQLTFFYKGASRAMNSIEPTGDILGCDILHFCRDYDGMFLKLIKKTDALVSFNPGYGLDELKRASLRKILKRTNILFINEHEERYLKSLFKKDIPLLGPEVAVKTIGPEGSIVSYRGAKIHTPAIKARLQDPTGAGDGFAAGFLAGIAEERELEYCARLGTAVACKVVGSRSAQPAFSREEIERIAEKCGKTSKKLL